MCMTRCPRRWLRADFAWANGDPTEADWVYCDCAFASWLQQGSQSLEEEMRDAAATAATRDDAMEEL